MPSMLAFVTALALASCNAPVAPLHAAGDSVYLVPDSIDRTGTADVTQQLNAFFASVPDGSDIQLPAGARYRVEGTVLLDNRHGLTIDGNGALFFAETTGATVPPAPGLEFKWPRHRTHLMLRGGGDLTVRNLRIRGGDPDAGVDGQYIPALEAQHGIELWGVQGANISHVQVSDVYGDLLYIGQSPNSTHIHVHDSHFEGSSRQGLSIIGARDVLVENNYFGDVRRSLIDFEPVSSTTGAENIVIRGNTFGRAKLLFIAAAGGDGRIDNILVEHNRLVGKTMGIIVRPPEGSRRSNIRILNNVTDATTRSPGAMMEFVRIDTLEVRGNVSPIATTESRLGVSVKQSCAFDVKDNDFIPVTPPGKEPQPIIEVEVTPWTCAGG